MAEDRIPLFGDIRSSSASSARTLSSTVINWLEIAFLLVCPSLIDTIAAYETFAPRPAESVCLRTQLLVVSVARTL
jgi:hypothetical protein